MLKIAFGQIFCLSAGGLQSKMYPILFLSNELLGSKKVWATFLHMCVTWGLTIFILKYNDMGFEIFSVVKWGKY